MEGEPVELDWGGHRDGLSPVAERWGSLGGDNAPGKCLGSMAGPGNERDIIL